MNLLALSPIKIEERVSWWDVRDMGEVSFGVIFWISASSTFLLMFRWHTLWHTRLLQNP